MTGDPHVLLDRLEGVTGEFPQWKARCPAHDDNKASLSVGVGDDGTVLIHCHADCEAEDVLRAVGLTWSDLGNGHHDDFVEKVPQSDHDGDALDWLSDYCDVDRDILDTLPVTEDNGVVHFEFGGGVHKCRKAGTKRMWWEPKGATNPPFWPVPDGDVASTIWLTEGETDCICARAMGLDAFAVTKGAKANLSPEHGRALARHGVTTVNIVFDADDAGRKGTEKAASVLSDAGLDVRDIDLADADLVDPLTGTKDVRDAWLQYQDPGVGEYLRDYAEQGTANDTGQRTWSTGDLLAAEFPEPVWVVPNLLPAGLSVLAGRPKLGKSFMALQLALAVGSGGMFLNERISQGRALYVALEDSPRRLQQRLQMMQASATSAADFAFDWKPLNGDGLGDLRQAAGGRQLVVVDTLTRAITSETDWDSVGQVTGVLDILQHIALDNNTCLLLIDHHRKNTGFTDNVVDDVLGSTAKAAVCDTIMGLYRQRGEHGATLRVTGRDIGDETLKLTFDHTTKCWQRVDVTVSGVQSEILDALKDLGAAGVTELARYLERDKGNVSKELAELEHKRKVRRRGNSRMSPYVLAA